MTFSTEELREADRQVAAANRRLKLAEAEVHEATAEAIRAEVAKSEAFARELGLQ
jgi:hypothetical protein